MCNPPWREIFIPRQGGLNPRPPKLKAMLGSFSADFSLFWCFKPSIELLELCVGNFCLVLRDEVYHIAKNLPQAGFEPATRRF